MTINKFQGKTEEEAKEKARQEMGADVVIMNVRTIKSKGFLGLFKQTTYEVTAAKEETEQGTPMAAFHSPFKMHEQINRSIFFIILNFGGFVNFTGVEKAFGR